MDEIRVRYTVDQKAAVMAGQKFFGDVETTVDPAALTEAQRQELAECSTEKGVFMLNRYLQDVGDIRVGTSDDAHVVTFLDARIRTRQEKATKEKSELADNYARCEALLKSADRATVLEKIVRDQKIGWVFPGSTQAAEKWWAAHQSEYSAEMDAIRARIEREKIEEDARIDAIQKQRADEALAAGIDGLLRRDDDNEWETRRIAESDYGRYYDQVSALHDRAEAEAERRNEAEKNAKASQIAAWVTAHGTENQKGRHALDLLSIDEVLDAMRNEAFSALETFARYEKIRKGDLEHDEYCEAGINCKVTGADHLTSEQYDQFAAIQKAAPKGSSVEALDHDCECAECDVKLTRTSARVELTVGAFTFTREYAL